MRWNGPGVRGGREVAANVHLGALRNAPAQCLLLITYYLLLTTLALREVHQPRLITEASLVLWPFQDHAQHESVSKRPTISILRVLSHWFDGT